MERSRPDFGETRRIANADDRSLCIAARRRSIGLLCPRQPQPVLRGRDERLGCDLEAAARRVASSTVANHARQGDSHHEAFSRRVANRFHRPDLEGRRGYLSGKMTASLWIHRRTGVNITLTLLDSVSNRSVQVWKHLRLLTLHLSLRHERHSVHRPASRLTPH